MDKRTQEQLDKIPPEKRAKLLEAMERRRTPEARAKEAAAREALEREQAETGTIKTIRRTSDPLAALGGEIRGARQDRGLTVDDLAELSGVERSALAKIERGANPNPTVVTLERLAGALGGQVRYTLEIPPVQAEPPARPAVRRPRARLALDIPRPESSGDVE